MLNGIPVLIVETTYPPPDDNDDDYCPDGEPWVHETRFTFRELVRMLQDRGYRNPSSFPIAAPDRDDWLTTDMETDMRTGEIVEHSIHLAPQATDREAKYWTKAWDAAGVRYNRRVKA